MYALQVMNTAGSWITRDTFVSRRQAEAYAERSNYLLGWRVVYIG
jgi:hypothetical protein